eukprot:4990542-Amphidinium_carterae.1
MFWSASTTRAGQSLSDNFPELFLNTNLLGLGPKFWKSWVNIEITFACKVTIRKQRDQRKGVLGLRRFVFRIGVKKVFWSAVGLSGPGFGCGSEVNDYIQWIHDYREGGTSGVKRPRDVVSCLVPCRP